MMTSSRNGDENEMEPEFSLSETTDHYRRMTAEMCDGATRATPYCRAAAAVEDVSDYHARAEDALARLRDPSRSLDPTYARFGVTPTVAGAEIAATLRLKEALDELEEVRARGTALVARARADVGEAPVVPPPLRTRTALLDYQDAVLLMYGSLGDDLNEIYWEAGRWREAEGAVHLVEQTRYGSLNGDANASGGGGWGLGATPAATLVAIATVSLLFLLSMPSLYKFVMRDPRQRPYKKKKKKAKSPQQQETQRSPTRKKAKRIKQKALDKPKKSPLVKSKNKARKTNSYKTGRVDEMKRCQQRWMERMHRVHAEARAQFKHIRQELDARNIARAPPKEKKTSTTWDAARALPVCPTSLTGIGRKAGKSQYLVQVGAVEHLHKTSKPAARRGKGRAAPGIPCVDLHGLTKTEALGELDEHLPRWIETAMRGSYPFVLPVRIVCGGGNQILSEAVAGWIREHAQVANALKERVL